MERAMRGALATRASVFGMVLCGAAVIFFASLVRAEDAPPAGNEIFDKLMKDGITLSDGTKENLPKPAMADGLTAAAQEKVIAGLVPVGRVTSFRGGNLNDWHELKITGKPAKEAGKTAARHIDL